MNLADKYSAYRPRHRESVKKRLLSRSYVDKHGCWIWEGPSICSGYGIIGLVARQLGVKRKGTYLVHRVSAAIFLGFNLLGQEFICHTCDIKKCVNPEHLFIGTHIDNMRDMWNKGRKTKDSQRHPRKLNPGIVTEIREKYSSGRWTNRSLAKEYGIGKSTIQMIISRKAWSHIL